MSRVSEPRKALARKALWTASLAVVLLVAAVTVSCGFGESRTFDPVTWRAESAVSCPERQSRRQMVEDIQENYLRRGMTQPEVKKLLGAPDVVTHRRRPEGWSYGLGARGSDCEYLYVGFAADDGPLVEWLADG